MNKNKALHQAVLERLKKNQLTFNDPSTLAGEALAIWKKANKKDIVEADITTMSNYVRSMLCTSQNQDYTPKGWYKYLFHTINETVSPTGTVYKFVDEIWARMKELGYQIDIPTGMPEKPADPPVPAHPTKRQKDIWTHYTQNGTTNQPAPRRRRHSVIASQSMATTDHEMFLQELKDLRRLGVTQVKKTLPNGTIFEVSF